ncbi:unnamed protein product [Closterium sp. NIES-64]|nr:unnamed protein product [Closterium sp. NIES-64]
MLILFVLLYDAADGFVVLLCCRIACCTMLLNQAIASGRPQLNRNKARMLGRTNSPAGPQDLYSAYDAALEEGIGPYAYVMRQHGLVPFPAWVHTALALPPRELDHSIVKPHYVHAVPVLHGKAAFSFVEFVDEQGETLHGRVHLLLSVASACAAEDEEDRAVAFVRRWIPQNVDECTGCMIMHPAIFNNGYHVVPIDAI